MKIDFSAEIKDFDGKALKEGDTAITLGLMAVRALNAQFPDEQPLSAEAKVSRFRIAVKVSEGGVQDLVAEDVVEIKKVIGRAFTPLIVGRSYALIEGPPSA